jgi:hypothetical protein
MIVVVVVPVHGFVLSWGVADCPAGVTGGVGHGGGRRATRGGDRAMDPG